MSLGTIAALDTHETTDASDIPIISTHTVEANYM